MPLLLCVVPEIAQERRVHRIARMALTHFPGMLMLWTTTEALLREYGPLAPIWLPGLAHQTEARRPARELRQSVFDVPLEQRGKG